MLRSQLSFLILISLIVCLVSCESGEAELIDYEVIGQDAITSVDASSATISISFPDGLLLADKLLANFMISEGADAFVDGSKQISGVTENNFEKSFTFEIVSEDEKVSKAWKVTSSNNSFTNNWGMGGFMKKEVSHNREYEWYINQAETGTFSDVNCAPSSVVMVSHWRNQDFSYSVENARSMYHPEGGGWFTEDIENCLMDYNIDHTIIDLSTSVEETSSIIQGQLDAGNILMICIDIHYLRLCENDSVRVDKYYETIKLGIGHCIVIKGYKIVDGPVFFEIYDPAGYNFRYSDGQSKGKDRYYRAADVFTATFGRWNHAFVIAGPGNTLKGMGSSMDASEIPNILIL